MKKKQVVNVNNIPEVILVLICFSGAIPNIVSYFYKFTNYPYIDVVTILATIVIGIFFWNFLHERSEVI